MISSATLSVTDRFALIAKCLCEAVAARVSARIMTGELIILICTRISGINKRLQALAAQIGAGTWHPDRAGTLRPDRADPRRIAGRKPPQFLFPRGFGWLILLVPQHAAGYGSQLRFLLADPDMATLIANPRIANILRPLCHMLAIPRDMLPPRPPRKPRPKPPCPQPQAVEPPAPEPAHTSQPPPPAEPAEAAPPSPPPAEPQANARAGPTQFIWPWLIEELRQAGHR